MSGQALWLGHADSARDAQAILTVHATHVDDA